MKIDVDCSFANLLCYDSRTLQWYKVNQIIIYVLPFLVYFYSHIRVMEYFLKY